jgi:hypothetical protein
MKEVERAEASPGREIGMAQAVASVGACGDWASLAAQAGAGCNPSGDPARQSRQAGERG